MRTLPLLLCIAVPCAAVPASAQKRPTPTSGRTLDEHTDTTRAVDLAGEALLAGRREDLSRADLARRLAASKADLPLLFDTLRAGQFPVRVGDEGNSVRRLGPDEARALVEAFGRRPWTRVREFLTARRALAPGDAERDAALRVLGANGEPGDVLALLDWATPGDGARPSRALAGSLREALAALLARHPEAARTVTSAGLQLDVALLPAVVSALGAEAAPERMVGLAELLGRVPRADALVMSELGHVARVARFVPPAEVTGTVRRALGSADRTVQLEAIAAAGHLRDPFALADLVAFLRHQDANVRARASEALAEISGEHLGADPEVWGDWHATLQLSFQSHAQELADRARNASPQVAVRAILELTKLRPYRDELTPELVPVLDRPDEELVLVACAALGHLGSKHAVGPLFACLERESVEVRRAAYLALRRVTGEDHGELVAAWRAAGW